MAWLLLQLIYINNQNPFELYPTNKQTNKQTYFPYENQIPHKVKTVRYMQVNLALTKL